MPSLVLFDEEPLDLVQRGDQVGRVRRQQPAGRDLSEPVGKVLLEQLLVQAGGTQQVEREDPRELRDLLLERHPAEQVLDPLLHRSCRIPVRSCLMVSSLSSKLSVVGSRPTGGRGGLGLPRLDRHLLGSKPVGCHGHGDGAGSGRPHDREGSSVERIVSRLAERLFRTGVGAAQSL